jgi:O-antigen/teichoic acid export membrane protein
MKEQRQLVRNAAVLMMATVVNKAIAFLTFPSIARLMGPEVTGVFFYSIAITSIFVTFADLGMTPAIIRAVAGKDDKTPRLIGAAFGIKFLLAPLAALAAWLYAYLRGGDALVLATVSVALLVMTADTFSLLLYGLLRGKQRLWPEALGMLVGQCVTSGISLYAAFHHAGPATLAAALACGSIWNVGWAAWHMYRLGLRPTLPKIPDVRLLVMYAWPFGLAGIAVKVYSYVDTLFIERLYGTIAVAMYAAAYKLTYALQF